MNNIQKADDSITAYQKLLDTEFANRREEIVKTKTSERLSLHFFFTEAVKYVKYDIIMSVKWEILAGYSNC